MDVTMGYATATKARGSRVIVWPRAYDSLVSLDGASTMRYLASITTILPFVSATLLNARTTVLHERRDTVPSGFVKVGAAPKQETLTLRLGLVQGDMSGLEERLYAVSKPSSPEYGRFLSKEEVSIPVDVHHGEQSELIMFRRSSRSLHPSKRRSTRSTHSFPRTASSRRPTLRRVIS